MTERRELFSLEAEHGVLVALMREVDHFDEIARQLAPADFHDLENAALFQTILDCQEAGHPVDPVTLGEFRHQLPSGSPTIYYAGQLFQNVASTANWPAYARVVRERAILRRVVQVADAVQELATEARPVPEIIAAAQQAMADLRDLDTVSEPAVVHVRDLLPAAIDRLDSEFNGVSVPKISTGLPTLDELLGGGLRPKSMVVIGGRPGSGKTTLGMQVAQHVATKGQGVGLVFSYEMPFEELVQRALASVGGVPLQHLDDGAKMREEDWPGLTSAVNTLNQSQLYLCERSNLTIARLRAEARAVQRRHGLSVLVVDYIGLMPGPGQTRVERVANNSTALKNLAKELGVPIIVLAQLNRESTKRTGAAKRPQASDLRDSGQIEQDADMVVLVHRDMDTEPGQNGVTELILDKARQAKLGSRFVQQQGQFARFVDFTHREPTEEEVALGRGRSYADHSYKEFDDE